MVQKLLVLVFFLPFVLPLQGQGIDFHHGSWDEALQEAQKAQKLIFVDGYATWCGPCKMLAKKIFPQKSVGDYFNKNFINVKMDMEKGEGRKFRRKYPMSAYPTLFFISPDGKLVQSTKGAPRTAEALIAIGAKASGKFDLSQDYMEKYEAGDRSYETMYNLVKTLNKSGKSSLKYANEYLRTQDDMSSKENLMFLFEALTQMDSRVFDEFAKHTKDFKNYYAADFIHTRVEKAANKTVSNAIEFDSPDLLKEAQDKYQQLYPKRSQNYKMSSNLTYATSTKDSELFLSSMKSGDFDVAKQKEIINSALNKFHEDEKVIKAAEKMAKSVATKEDSAAGYYLLAMTQVKLEKVNQAIKSLDKCIEKTNPETREYQIYLEHLQKLKSK